MITIKLYDYTLTFGDWQHIETVCMLPLINVNDDDKINKMINEDGAGILIVQSEDAVHLKWVNSYMHTVRHMHKSWYPNFNNLQFKDLESAKLHIDKFLDRINSLMIFI